MTVCGVLIKSKQVVACLPEAIFCTIQYHRALCVRGSQHAPAGFPSSQLHRGEHAPGRGDDRYPWQHFFARRHHVRTVPGSAVWCGFQHCTSPCHSMLSFTFSQRLHSGRVAEASAVSPTDLLNLSSRTIHFKVFQGLPPVQVIEKDPGVPHCDNRSPQKRVRQ